MIKDSELKIAKIFKQLSGYVSDDKLGLKDRQKEKSRRMIEKMGQDYFKKIINTYEELNNKLDNIESEISSSLASKKQDTINEKLKKKEASVDQLKRRISAKESEAEKIDINVLNDKVSKAVNQIAQVTILD